MVRAYALIQALDGRTLACTRVRLMEPREVVALVRRREQLLAGEFAPLPNGAPHLCRVCPERTQWVGIWVAALYRGVDRRVRVPPQQGVVPTTIGRGQ